MQRPKNVLLILFSLVALALVPLTASAQTSCHLLTSANPVPEGFGAAYNLFSSTNEPLLQVNCGPASDATLQVGNGEETVYIYKTGYEWTGSSWRELALRGQARAGDWYLGSAEASLVRSETQLSQDNLVVAYTCFWDGRRWKCGCRDTACGTSSWQLQAFRYEQPQPPMEEPGKSDSIPEPARTVRVSSSSQLSSAISNAQAGDHIVLANGTYPGFKVSRSGQSGTPIVIRAANKLEAKVNGPVVLDGNDVWVVGIDLNDTSGTDWLSRGVKLNGDRTRISSSRIQVDGRGIEVPPTATGVVVDHNELDGALVPCDARTRFLMVILAGDDMKPHVYRNYFHSTKARCGNGDDQSAMHVGGNSQQSRRRVGALVEYNLYENILGDDEIISNKSSSNTYRFNTVIGGKELVNRHGENNLWIANWVGGGASGIRIHDRGHTVAGNVAPTIRAYAGSVTVQAYTSQNISGYPPAEDLLFVGNTSKLLIGYSPSSSFNVPSNHITIEGHEGSVVQDNVNEGAVTIRSSTSRAVTKAFKLSRPDVGPFAPTAPKLSADAAGGT